MRTYSCTCAFAPSALLVALVAGLAPAQTPAVLSSVEVYPPDVNLFTSRSRQSVVVKATYADGITRDVSAEAKYSFANPAVVKFEKNVLYPAADGATDMKVEFGGQALNVPVKVKEAKV